MAGALKGVTDLADGYQTLAARVGNVATSGVDANEILAELAGIAARTHAPLLETGNLFTRLATATKDLKVPQQDLLQFTEAINNALRLNGTSAAEASGAMLQLAQALGAGALRGEEFNSVNEQMPAMLDALAEYLGKTRGELKGLVSRRLDHRPGVERGARHGRPLGRRGGEVTRHPQPSVDRCGDRLGGLSGPQSNRQGRHGRLVRRLGKRISEFRCTGPGGGRGGRRPGGLQIAHVRHHAPDTQGGPASGGHLRQAAAILGGMLTAVAQAHPDWPPAWQLRGAVAAYNAGPGNVRTQPGLDKGTTGNDYSADAWARARWFGRTLWVGR